MPTTWVGRTLEIMVQDGEVVIGLEGEEITRHQLQPPGGISIYDEHLLGVRKPLANWLGRPVTPHDLRHFYASALIRHGADVKLVQA